MYVIFLSPHCDPEAQLGEPDSGGQCVYEHQLALALSELPDIKVLTFCRQTFQRPDISLISNSYEIHRIQCGNIKTVRKEVIETVLDEFTTKVSSYLRSHVSLQDKMVVHAHYWDGGYTALALKSNWPNKLPLIWTPHSLASSKKRKFVGSSNEFFYNFIPRQTWESYTMHVADKVIVSTEDEREVVLNDYVTDLKKIEIISPGVDFYKMQRIDQKKARQDLGLPIEGKILLGLGRMVKNKGYHHSMMALKKLLELYDQPLYFVLFGGAVNPTAAEEKEYLAELNSIITDHHLQDNVILKSAVPHDQIFRVFSAADIFLMSSEYEPFGLVTLEAMTLSVPVVAANSGGSLNIIRHNKTGILTDFHQPDGVANYIFSLLKDEDLYQQIVENGRRQIKKSYDWHQKSGYFADVYRQVSRYLPEEEFQDVLAHNHFLQQHFRVRMKG